MSVFVFYMKLTLVYNIPFHFTDHRVLQYSMKHYRRYLPIEVLTGGIYEYELRFPYFLHRRDCVKVRINQPTLQGFSVSFREER